MLARKQSRPHHKKDIYLLPQAVVEIDEQADLPSTNVVERVKARLKVVDPDRLQRSQVFLHSQQFVSKTVQKSSMLRTTLRRHSFQNKTETSASSQAPLQDVERLGTVIFDRDLLRKRHKHSFCTKKQKTVQ